MIEKIIAELEKMDKKLDSLQAEIDRLQIGDPTGPYLHYTQGEYSGITWSYRQLKRLIDQTPEGIAWEREQGEAEW